ncbi:MAG: hypothetical protein P1P85_04210 [Patescibacteria group bacterium]|nr:hypothetical protein [Patescibacteria group bacterium]
MITKKENNKPKENDKSKENNKPKSNDKKKVKYFLWLKIRAYVNDTDRIEKGFYALDSIYHRLAEAKSDVCEIFEGEVPSRTLTKIALSSGVDPDKYESDEELLNVLLKKNVIII